MRDIAVISFGQRVNERFHSTGNDLEILIDGADSVFMSLIQGIPHDQVRLGLRVRAVWVPDDELTSLLSTAPIRVVDIARTADCAEALATP